MHSSIVSYLVTQQEITILQPLSITQIIGMIKLVEDILNDKSYLPRFSSLYSTLPTHPN